MRRDKNCFILIEDVIKLCGPKSKKILQQIFIGVKRRGIYNLRRKTCTCRLAIPFQFDIKQFFFIIQVINDSFLSSLIIKSNFDMLKSSYQLKTLVTFPLILWEGRGQQIAVFFRRVGGWPINMMMVIKLMSFKLPWEV